VPGDQRPAQADFADSDGDALEAGEQSGPEDATGLQGADGATAAPGCAAVEAQNQVDSRGAALLDSALLTMLRYMNKRTKAGIRPKLFRSNTTLWGI